MNTDKTARIALEGFMAGHSLSSSIRTALAIYDDLPADERPTDDRETFRRAAACAAGMYYNTRTTDSDVRNVLQRRFGA